LPFSAVLFYQQISTEQGALS